MLKITLLFCLLWCAITMALANEAIPVQKTRLFILSGQSNMVRLNPDDTFAPTLQKAFPNDAIIIIKDAKGGQPISRWTQQADIKKDGQAEMGDLYDKLMAKVKVRLAGSRFDTVTLVWMQGERDAKEHQGDQYEGELRRVISQFKQDMQRDDVYLVLGRLSDFGLDKQKITDDWQKVRNAQMHIAETDSRAAWVDTDDLNGPENGLHYTDEGYKTFGERLAQAAITLLKK